MKKVMMLIAATLMSVMQVNAQTAKVDDKELIGVWLMESMQWEGEKKVVCGKAIGYTQFKYYGADGEYACAQLSMTRDGKCVVAPHEYGTYTFKDGWYSEMGRKATNDGIKLIDKNTFKGRWQDHYDIWKRANLSDKAIRYIVDYCKAQNIPTNIEEDILKEMFSK